MFVDLERLHDARESIEVTRALAPAIDALQSVQVGSLGAPVISVTTKNVLAPTNDPHDFLSIPTYFWPNPNSDDGLPWVRRDGHPNPDAGRTDVGRFFRLVDEVEVLALRAWYCSDLGAGHRSLELVRGWFLDPETRMNPSLEYAHMVPGARQGWSSGVMNLQRAYLLLDLLAIVAECGVALAIEEDRALRRWFRQFRDWLVSSDQGTAECKLASNHGTWYDVQVVAYSRFIGDVGFAHSWLEEVTAPRLRRQIRRDGAQPKELRRVTPIEYAVFNLFGFVVLAEMARPLGVDLWSEEGKAASISRAIDWLLPYLDLDKPIGATSKHRGTFTIAAEATQILRIASVRLDRPDYEDALVASPLHTARVRANLLAPPRSVVAGRTPLRSPPPAVIRSPARTYAKAFIVGPRNPATDRVLATLDSHPQTVVGPDSQLGGRGSKPLADPGANSSRDQRTFAADDGSIAAWSAEQGLQRAVDRDSPTRPSWRRRSRSTDDRAVRDAVLDSYFVAHRGSPGRTFVVPTHNQNFLAEVALERWPEARVVEVAPDASDVTPAIDCPACAQAERRQRQEWFEAARRVEDARSSARQLGRWHVVRCEDLQNHPRREVQRIFQFLDLVWDEGMIDDIAEEVRSTLLPATRSDCLHRKSPTADENQRDLTARALDLPNESDRPAWEQSGGRRQSMNSEEPPDLRPSPGQCGPWLRWRSIDVRSHQRPRVFGIGFNKTGTTSLREALDLLRFETLHFGGPPVHKAVQRAIDDGLPLLSYLNPVFDGYCDVRLLSERFDILDRQYPGSRFVLTTRSLADWLDSRRRNVARNQARHAQGQYAGSFPLVNEEKWTAKWHEHHVRVRSYFAGRPNFVEIDLSRTPSWDGLCALLGCAEPDEPYPWLNRNGSVRRKSLGARLRAKVARPVDPVCVQNSPSRPSPAVQ